MKNLIRIFLAIICISTFGQFPELAKTPPMGWNSWNAFALEINSTIVKAVADSMVSKGLAAAGYQYIVIDDGWQIDRDKNGKIIADSTRFPEGIKYLADYVHSKGLKFGIYTCCGTKTCGGRPGSYGFEAIDAKTYADWGVDYIKEDWCFTTGLDAPTQYKIMSDAIRATGRPMLLSLCEWGVSSPWEWANGVGAMWRTTNDIQDCHDCIRNWGGMGWVHILNKNADLAPYAGPGHWNDPDMLEVGNGGLSITESKSHFTMWCMIAAPLIAGNNISTMNDSIRNILTAPEIIAIDQDPLGIQGIRVRNIDNLQVWQKPLSDGSMAVALLNLSNEPATMFVTLEEIGFKKGISSKVRDLWNRKNLNDITDKFETKVLPHDVVVIKVKGEKSAITSMKFNQTDVEINKGNHRLIKLDVIPPITPASVTSSNPDITEVSVAGVNIFKLTAKNEGSCTITATTKEGNLSTACAINVMPSSVPSPWKLDDIKDNKASAYFDNGIFTIEGGGSDIWNGSDQFAFLNREAKNDNVIIARILSQTNTDPWAKTGLMFRENTDANSKFVLICATPANGISLQWRDSTGGNCDKKDFKEAPLPIYLKLERKGNTFKAYQSADGIEWNLLDTVTLAKDLMENYLAGLLVLSHSSHQLNLSKFDHVELQPIE